MKLRSLLPFVAVAGVAFGVYWLRCRNSAPDDAGMTGSASSPADQLKLRPKRTRWAAPLCKPSGVVKLPSGAPAAGAVVLLQSDPLRGVSSPSDEPDAVTGGDGRFELPAVAAGTWRLVAASPSHTASSRELVLATAADCAGLELVLGPVGESVTGSVTDVSGGPIQHAVIVGRATAARSASPIAALAMTGADGRYQLVVARGDYTMSVTHPQYAGVSRQLAVRSATTFDVVLTPGGELRGVVLTRERREPVPGARVTVHGGRASGAMGGLVREAVSDDDGRFVVTGLGSGRTFVSAVGPAHASRDRVELALGIAESRSDLEILVDPARRIRGVVMHDEKPAIDAVVMAYRTDVDPGLQTLETPAEINGMVIGNLTTNVDPDGVFELWGLAPGMYQLGAVGPHATAAQPVNVDIQAADADGVQLVLGRGATVRGRVEPAQAATVSLVDFGMMGESERWLAQSEVATDASGRFEIHGIESGEQMLYARTATGATGEVQFDAATIGNNEVVIPLAVRGTSVRGRVVDTRGQPVSGATVSGFTAVTSSDGSFHATEVEPGEYGLSVVAADGDIVAVTSPKEPNIVVPPAGIDHLAITVEPSDRTIRGVVIGADGKPGADAWVVAFSSYGHLDPDALGLEGEGPPADASPPDLSSGQFDWTGTTHIALTDSSGRFSIGGLRDRVYDLAAEGERGNARGVTRAVKAGQSTTVKLTALATLTVSVVRGNAAVGRYQLEVMGPEPDFRPVDSADGKVTLRSVPPGEYAVRAIADDTVGTATVEVTQGSAASVTVALEPVGTLTGQIVDETGAPLKDVYVFSTTALPDLTGTPGTDADGRFEVKRVPPGPGELQVWSIDEGKSIPYNLAPGQRIDVGVIRIPKPMSEPNLEGGEPL